MCTDTNVNQLKPGETGSQSSRRPIKEKTAKGAARGQGRRVLVLLPCFSVTVLPAFYNMQLSSFFYNSHQLHPFGLVVDVGSTSIKKRIHQGTNRSETHRLLSLSSRHHESREILDRRGRLAADEAFRTCPVESFLPNSFVVLFASIVRTYLAVTLYCGARHAQ